MGVISDEIESTRALAMMSELHRVDFERDSFNPITSTDWVYPSAFCEL